MWESTGDYADSLNENIHGAMQHLYGQIKKLDAKVAMLMRIIHVSTRCAHRYPKDWGL